MVKNTKYSIYSFVIVIFMVSCAQPMAVVTRSGGADQVIGYAPWGTLHLNLAFGQQPLG